jgi:dipeptidyl aminopeptidase/acylaminoacyl peptidase
MRIGDLTALAIPSQPALSPDGARLVYVLRTVDEEADRHVDQLWVVGTAAGDPGATPRRLTNGTGDTTPRWSPDGSRLAFVRERDGVAQVWLLSDTGGDAEQVTYLSLGAGVPVWSPDGSRMAFTAAVDPAPRGTGPIVATRLDYQADGDGMLGAVRNQVHVLDLASGECRQVTDGPEHAGEPAWAADGRTLAFTRRVGADSDLTLRTAVHLLDVDDAVARPRVVAFEDGIASTVDIADDGSLLVVGWPGDLVGSRAPVPCVARRWRPGGPVRSPGPQRHAGRHGLPRCSSGRHPLTACCSACGTAAAPTCGSPAEGAATPVLDGPGRVVSGLSVVGSTAVVALATATSYGEIVLLDRTPARSACSPSHGASVSRHRAVRARRAHVPDQRRHRGAGLDHPRPALSAPGPLVVDVHGGPHNAWNDAADEMHHYHQELAARGWTVLLVNPRGSDGYGEAFYDGVNRAWGVADANDFLEPVDELVAEGSSTRNGWRSPATATAGSWPVTSPHTTTASRPPSRAASSAT